MKKKLKAITTLSAMTILAAACANAQTADQPAKSSLVSNATEAYLYFYAPVTLYKSSEVMSNTERPAPNQAPMGQLIIPPPINASFQTVVRPNLDTGYAIAYLDFYMEDAYVFSTPDFGKRYILITLLDVYTDVTASYGSRTGNTKAQRYVITKPGFKGTIPSTLSDAIVIESESMRSMLLTRLQFIKENDTEADALRKQYTLVPLKQYGKVWEAPKGTYNPDLPRRANIAKLVNSMSAAEYFDYAVALWNLNPVPARDKDIVAKLKTLGIEHGKPFSFAAASPEVKAALTAGQKDGLASISSDYVPAKYMIDNWYIITDTGNYGTDYKARAFIAMFGFGANLAEDAVYPLVLKDADGQEIQGGKKYRMHFPKGHLPPNKAFFSLTMYDAEGFLIENPANKYAASSWMNLHYNADGSLDFIIQPEKPSDPKMVPNWLPNNTKGPLGLTLRVYRPDPSVLKGEYKIPYVEAVK